MITLENGRRDLYQWDINQHVIVEGYPAGTQIHFTTGCGSEPAPVLEAYEKGGQIVADIPNQFLTAAGTLKVYVYHSEDDGGYTVEKREFIIKGREKPSDYVYTETEVKTFSSLDERLTKLEGEGLANAVAEYLEQNPVEAGATEEEAAQIKQNKENIEKLNTDKLDASELPEAVNVALAQAKESGAFDGKDGADGKDGYTPQKGIDYFDGKDGQPGEPGKDGYTPVKGVDYFDGVDGKDGTPGKDGADGQPGKDGQPGADGKDYVLTDADRAEIAEMAAGLVEVPESGGIEVTGAEVGQTIVVKAVDDNGKPTEWETADLPQGGGGAEWKLLKSETLAEDVSSLFIKSETPVNEFLLLFTGRVNDADDTKNSGFTKANVRPVFNGAISPALMMSNVPFALKSVNMLTYIHIKRENKLLKAEAHGGGYGHYIFDAGQYSETRHGAWIDNDATFNGVFIPLSEYYFKSGSNLEVWVR